MSSSSGAAAAASITPQASATQQFEQHKDASSSSIQVEIKSTVLMHSICGTLSNLTLFGMVFFSFFFLFSPFFSDVCPVGYWRWEMNDDADVCGICRMPYHACCPGAKFPGDDCPPGTCNEFGMWKMLV